MTHTYEAVASTALAAVIGIWIEGKGSTFSLGLDGPEAFDAVRRQRVLPEETRSGHYSPPEEGRPGPGGQVARDSPDTRQRRP